MQTSKAITKYIRVQPRKARLAADLIRGLPIAEAEMQLDYCKLKVSPYLKKTLKSAVANAEMNWNARREKLQVLEVRIDNGPSFKRAKPKCRGGRTPILKKMSHLTVVVGEGENK